MILYINSCVRNNSRTNELALYLLSKLGRDYTEVKTENIFPLNSQSLEKRSTLIELNDYSDSLFDLAKQFAEADTVVISAPFWDLSFPASLKAYIENIFVNGITFRYNEDGIPVGLCKADKLYYISTAGGKFMQKYGYNYIKSAAVNMLGIKNTVLIKAEMLDVAGFDPKKIIDESKKEIDIIYCP